MNNNLRVIKNGDDYLIKAEINASDLSSIVSHVDPEDLPQIINYISGISLSHGLMLKQAFGANDCFDVYASKDVCEFFVTRRSFSFLEPEQWELITTNLTDKELDIFEAKLGLDLLKAVRDIRAKAHGTYKWSPVLIRSNNRVGRMFGYNKTQPGKSVSMYLKSANVKLSALVLQQKQQGIERAVPC